MMAKITSFFDELSLFKLLLDVTKLETKKAAAIKDFKLINLAKAHCQEL